MHLEQCGLRAILGASVGLWSGLRVGRPEDQGCLLIEEWNLERKQGKFQHTHCLPPPDVCDLWVVGWVGWGWGGMFFPGVPSFAGFLSDPPVSTVFLYFPYFRKHPEF